MLTFPANGTLAASTLYDLYLFEAAGVVQVQVSTQRPASPYLGEARTKGGPDNTDPNVSPDNKKRWLGRFLTDGAGAILASSVVSARHGSDFSPGILEMADDAEALALAARNRAISPAALKAVLTPEAWHNVGATGEPAFQNGWANLTGGARDAAGYRKNALGDVVLQCSPTSPCPNRPPSTRTTFPTSPPSCAPKADSRPKPGPRSRVATGRV